MKGFNILCLALVVFMNLACKKQAKVVDEVSIPEKNEATFFVDNNSDSPIRIRFFRSMFDSLETDYYAYEGKDTVIVPIHQPEVILISHKSIYSDTLYVAKGDSISIRLPRSEEAFQFSGNIKRDFKPSTKQAHIDSLFNLYISTKSSFKPLEIKTDFEKINLGFPLSLNTTLLDSDTITFNLLVDGLIDKLSEQNIALEGNSGSTAWNNLQLDLEKRKAFIRLRSLQRLTKNKAINDKIFASPIYTDDFLKESRFGMTYLLTFLTQKVLDGKTDSSTSMVYIDFKDAYDKLPNHMPEGELLKLAREKSLYQMIEYKEPYAEISNYLNEYMMTYKDSTFLDVFTDQFLLGYEKQVNEKVGLNLLKEKR